MAKKGCRGVWLCAQESGGTVRARSGTLYLRSEGLGGVFVDARDRCKACEI